MNQYILFVLGIVLGIAIGIYFYTSREEKIERMIAYDKKVFSTEKLDIAMKNVVDRIKLKIKDVKRELTEEEKNEIIAQCCKEKFD